MRFFAASATACACWAARVSSADRRTCCLCFCVGNSETRRSTFQPSRGKQWTKGGRGGGVCTGTQHTTLFPVQSEGEGRDRRCAGSTKGLSGGCAHLVQSESAGGHCSKAGVRQVCWVVGLVGLTACDAGAPVWCWCDTLPVICIRHACGQPYLAMQASKQAAV